MSHASRFICVVAALFSFGARANSAGLRHFWRPLAVIFYSVCLTTIAAIDATGAPVIAGWDTSALPGGSNNFGPSPFGATTTAANATVTGLVRGTGVGTGGTAAPRGWGGVNWLNTTAADAVTNNDFVTFTVKSNAGYTLSLDQVDLLSYRRSGTGPTTGMLAYSINGGAFSDITSLAFSSSATAGATLPAIALSGISALQNLAATSTVTFRIANYGGTNSAGTWYIYDTAISTANDFSISGTVAAVAAVPELSSFLVVGLGGVFAFGAVRLGKRYGLSLKM